MLMISVFKVPLNNLIQYEATSIANPFALVNASVPLLIATKNDS